MGREIKNIVIQHSIDAVISDNEQIRNYVTQFYKSDSYLIEYGADHVNRISFNDEYCDEFERFNGIPPMNLQTTHELMNSEQWRVEEDI